MTKETWSAFKSQACLLKFWPVKNHGFARNWSERSWRAIKFIKNLLKRGVSLDQIDINDWNSSSYPRVYVGNKRYYRLAKNDYKLALKHLKKLKT